VKGDDVKKGKRRCGDEWMRNWLVNGSDAGFAKEKEPEEEEERDKVS
jgi:hypothetical protein